MLRDALFVSAISVVPTTCAPQKCSGAGADIDHRKEHDSPSRHRCRIPVRDCLRVSLDADFVGAFVGASTESDPLGESAVCVRDRRKLPGRVHAMISRPSVFVAGCLSSLLAVLIVVESHHFCGVWGFAGAVSVCVVGAAVVTVKL